ncbi:Hsp20/alpha crystallin family protein [Dichotomicrobium thermohalophilum]|uniref:HSP20 family protein n=1 Tax=Dichotomicrobium thermohalophilum TaxID=933063 RepID=A0A397Q1Z6_9HYPH|nr:Hsp20/alpha crystallin family protein [Dichotomicrobium thermohalophilum]RIA55078.1 HSP20 family protein [Dichotomicrobium thermohalophilum]
MSLQSWLPSWPSHRREEEGPFAELHKQMDELFDDWARTMRAPVAARRETGVLRPMIDVSETDDAFKIIAELPGVEEKDIDVTVSDDRLTIKAEKHKETEEKGEHFHRMERSYGTFERTMTLPRGVDTENVDAEMKNGTLTVTIPKTQSMKEHTRKIQVKKSD